MCLLACWSRPDSDSRRGMKRSACSGFEHISATLRHHRYMLRGCTEPQAPSSALPVGTSFRSPCAYTSAPSLHLSTTAFNEGLGRGFLSESKRDSQSKCPASNFPSTQTRPATAKPTELRHSHLVQISFRRCLCSVCKTLRQRQGPWSLHEHALSRCFAFRYRTLTDIDRSSTASKDLL